MYHLLFSCNFQWVAMLARFEAPDSSSSYCSSDSEEDSGSKPGLKRKHSSSESDSSSAGDVPAKRVEMALSQLYMLDDNQGQSRCESTESTFAKQGKNPKRVKLAFKQHCCKAPCKRKLPFKLMMHMVTIFWSLSKACQDCVLWSMQQKDLGDQFVDEEEDSDSGTSSTSSVKHKISWFIEGLDLLAL